MSDNPTWQAVALAFVTALPAIVGAFLSHRNGRKIDDAVNGGSSRSSTSPVKKRPKKNGLHPDWYKPPNLH
jgi:hypothetical protein